MLKREALGLLLRLLPGEWKQRLSIHLGVPHVRWSLRQLRHFGFTPSHVLDIGAFQGDWARACLNVFPDVRMTCVEPQDEQQPTLRELALQTGNIHVVQTLLGRRNLSGVPFSEMGSGSSVLSAPKGCTRTKPMATVDTLIESGQCQPPDLVKLDVQGYEIEVLEGWTESFYRCQIIQCEMSLIPIVAGAPLLHEVIAYLFRRGFVVFDVTELIRSPSDGAVWQIDALFCRCDSPLRLKRAWTI